MKRLRQLKLEDGLLYEAWTELDSNGVIQRTDNPMLGDLCLDPYNCEFFFDDVRKSLSHSEHLLEESTLSSKLRELNYDSPRVTRLINQLAEIRRKISKDRELGLPVEQRAAWDAKFTKEESAREIAWETEVRSKIQTKRRRLFSDLDIADQEVKSKKSEEYREYLHCFNCENPLANGIDLECVTCGWTVCNCGVCGCVYWTKNRNEDERKRFLYRLREY
jgi:hypothetical protein